jgi:hypothetical protein
MPGLDVGSLSKRDRRVKAGKKLSLSLPGLSACIRPGHVSIVPTERLWTRSELQVRDLGTGARKEPKDVVIHESEDITAAAYKIHMAAVNEET